MNVKEIKFLLTHSSIYGLGTMVAQAVAFFMLPIYTRYLTPSDYGTLELIDITNMLIGIVLTLGIARGMSRFYYEENSVDHKDSVVCTTFIIFITIGIIFLPLLIIFSEFFSKFLFKHDKYTIYFIISFISLFLGGIIDIGLMYFRLIKSPIIFVKITLTRLIMLLSLNIIFIVIFKFGVLGILLSSLITRLFYSLLILVLILRKISFKFSKSLYFDIIKFCYPLIPANLMDTAIKQSDKYFVLYFFALGDMGIYSLALKLGNAIHLLLTMPFTMVYIPRRFELLKKDNPKYVYRNVYTYYSVVFITTGLFISIFIHEILLILVSNQFLDASKYVPLVILSLFFLGSQYHFDFGILYTKKTKYFAYINLYIAILHLLINYYLIRNYGLWGAVIGSNIVLLLQAGLNLYISEKNYKIEYELLKVSKLLSIAIAIQILSYFVQNNNLFIIICIKILLFTLYLSLIIILKIVQKDTIEELAQLLNLKMKGILIRFKI